MGLSGSDHYRAFGRAYGMGDLAAATEALERCLDDQGLADSPERVAFFLRQLAQIALDMSDTGLARDRLVRAESAADASSLNLYYVAGLYLVGLGRPSEALPRANLAASVLESEALDASSEAHWRALVRALRGRCLAALGRLDEAASELEALRLDELVPDHTIELCEALMESPEHRELAVRCLRELAADLQETGEPERIALADGIAARIRE